MEETRPLIESKTEVPGTRLNLCNLLMNNVIICLLSAASNMYQPVMSQYIYHRVADSVFGNNTEIENFTVLAPCFQNISDKGYVLVEEAQELTSTIMWQQASSSAAIAVFSNILLGSYSDVIGRKLLFLCPMVGHLLRNAITAVIIYWHLDVNFFYLAVGIDGLLGGEWALLLATLAYAADNTPPAGSRSLTIIIIECVIGLSAAGASTATGYFIQNTGFFYPSLTAAGITLLDMILVALFIKSSYTQDTPDNVSVFSGMANFKDMYFSGTLLNRSIFWTGLVLFFFTNLSSGDSNIYTLFLMNLPFCWSPEKFGIYDTISTVVRKTLGIGIAKMLQCCYSDHMLGIFGLLSDIGGSFLYAFATVDWMLYLGYPVVGILGFIPTPMVRAILSKQVPYNKQGSIFASMAVVQALCSIFSATIFNNIYRYTVPVWHGAVYFALGLNDVICFFIFITLAILLKKQGHLRRMDLNIQVDDQ